MFINAYTKYILSDEDSIEYLKDMDSFDIDFSRQHDIIVLAVGKIELSKAEKSLDGINLHSKNVKKKENFEMLTKKVSF